MEIDEANLLATPIKKFLGDKRFNLQVPRWPILQIHADYWAGDFDWTVTLTMSNDLNAIVSLRMSVTAYTLWINLTDNVKLTRKTAPLLLERG